MIRPVRLLTRTLCFRILSTYASSFVQVHTHSVLVLICYTNLGFSVVTFDAHHKLPRFIETLPRNFHFAEKWIFFVFDF